MQEGVQLGNCGFCKEAESAMCAQINVEQTIGHIYESLSAYFGRDNISLPGLAAFFAKEADEERKHARLIIDYVNERGGIVKLGAIEAPHGDFREAEKGDALNAMELALALEKVCVICAILWRG
jgi:ferritin heavy chain